MTGPADIKVYKGYDEAAIFELLGHDASAPVLIVAAHMDDETIGAGALLRYLRDVSFLHVTDGSARNMRAARARGFATRKGYAAARASELREALNAMPCAPRDLTTLEIPDLDASYNLAAITLAVKMAVKKSNAAVVVTHPYEGGHPDHDSAAFATACAAAMIRDEGGAAPEIMEFTSYHGDGKRMVTSRFLSQGPDEARVELSGDERLFKAGMFECYSTQKGALKNFHISEERFRKAPLYDFTRPPHEGRLFYQHFDWGLPGRMWNRLAAKALQELGLGQMTPARSMPDLSPRAIYRYMRYLRSRAAFP